MTLDRFYNPEFDLFLALDKGYRNPNVTIWLQPDAKGERVVALYAHYQFLRTPDENALIAMEIHRQRGYGQLKRGWGDPSAPDMLRAYTRVFGVDILGPQRSVKWGHEIVGQWLKTSKITRGAMGLVFAPDCQTRFVDPTDPKKVYSLTMEMRDYEVHEPGKGKHHGPDGLRYFYAGWEG